MSVIKRSVPPRNFRSTDEVSAAREQIGDSMRKKTSSWYRGIYDFYQNNEC